MFPPYMNELNFIRTFLQQQLSSLIPEFDLLNEKLTALLIPHRLFYNAHYNSVILVSITNLLS
jgi:hypothetical protein